MIIFQILSRGVSMCRNGSKILPQKSAFYSGEWGVSLLRYIQQFLQILYFTLRLLNQVVHLIN